MSGLPPALKVSPRAAIEAIRNQGKIKFEDYPFGNRAARRRAAKGKLPGMD